MANGSDDIKVMFLLEVLVDSLTMPEPSVYQDTGVISDITDTCVHFQFLNYPPLVFYENDSLQASRSRSKTYKINFKEGKSCLFYVTIPKLPIVLLPFGLRVCVIHKLKDNLLPETLNLYIGNATIDMSEYFTELMRKSIVNESHILPISKNKKGVFEIKCSNGMVVGHLLALFRLSSFGNLSNTKMGRYKEYEDSYLYEEIITSRKLQEPRYNQLLFMNDNETKQTGPTQLPPTNEDNMADSISCFNKKLSFCDQQENNSSIKRKCNNIDDYSTLQKSHQYDDSEYIKRNKLSETNKYERRLLDTLFGFPEIPNGCTHTSTSCKPAPRRMRNTCACLYSFHPSVPPTCLGNTMDRGTKEEYTRDRPVLFPLNLKKPGEVLTGEDKIIESTVYYKLTSEEESSTEKLNKNAQNMSDGASEYGDETNDEFWLKIGKKMDAEKKRKLELEIKNNKIAVSKPRLADQDCQYENADIPSLNYKNNEINMGRMTKGKKN